MTHTTKSAVPHTAPPQDDFERHVERCLAMVMHHDEVQAIARIVKKVHADRMAARHGNREGGTDAGPSHHN